jgi:Ca-activated chloride channel family protein
MSFERPEMLQALWGIALWLPLMVWRLRRNTTLFQQWVTPSLAQHNVPQRSSLRPLLAQLLLIIAFAGAVVTAAGPRWGFRERADTLQAHDIVVALDISKSMLAEDLKPNRLERAKLSLKNLIRRRPKDRLGIVIFAGSAALQLPLTTDKAAADALIDQISTESISIGGTNISAALERSLIAFGEPGPANRALILISDGEDHEEGALEKAAELARQGIRIFTIGIGKPEGVPIPVYINGRFQGYKTDENGRTVVTRLNEHLLRDMARIGGGLYMPGHDLSAALDAITEEIDRLESAELAVNLIDTQANRFYYFAGATLLLLLTEFFMPWVRPLRSKHSTLFD